MYNAHLFCHNKRSSSSSTWPGLALGDDDTASEGGGGAWPWATITGSGAFCFGARFVC